MKISKVFLRIEYPDGNIYCVVLSYKANKAVYYETYEILRTTATLQDHLKSNSFIYKSESTREIDFSIPIGIRYTDPIRIVEEQKEEIDDLREERISIVNQEYVGCSILKEIYGVNERLINRLRDDSLVIEKGEGISRFSLEKALLSNKILTFQSASLELGIKRESLKELLNTFVRQPLKSFTFDNDLEIVENDAITQIKERMRIGLMPLVQGKTQWLKMLHEKIQVYDSISVIPEYCFISRAFSREKDQWLIAQRFDILLLRPISIKYSIPLKSNKPSYLPRDYTSTLCAEVFADELKDALLYYHRTPKKFEHYNKNAIG